MNRMNPFAPPKAPGESHAGGQDGPAYPRVTFVLFLWAAVLGALPALWTMRTLVVALITDSTWKGAGMSVRNLDEAFLFYILLMAAMLYTLLERQVRGQRFDVRKLVGDVGRPAGSKSGETVTVKATCSPLRCRNAG